MSVGYGKPPKHSQFKPGQSGNPKGRPKGARSMDKILKDELMGKIEITDHGKKKTVTKLEALAKVLVSQSLKGNAKAQDQLLKLLPPELLADLESELSKMPTPEEDLALILKFAPELVAANGGPGDNSD